MKKVLFVFMMFFAFTSFANNSEEKVKESKFIITNNKFIKKSEKSNVVTVYCYATIRNSETGETRKIYAVGDTLEACSRNAYALALKVVDNLNGN
jgi:transcription elongation GreA/GreB family factor